MANPRFNKVEVVSVKSKNPLNPKITDEVNFYHIFIFYVNKYFNIKKKSYCINTIINIIINIIVQYYTIEKYLIMMKNS